MSIKPIDYINIISKSQEASRIKHIENEKSNIQFQQGIVQQKKHIESELKKVKKANKSEYKIIDKYDHNKGNKHNNKHKSDNKKKKREEKRIADIGVEIDIKIWYEVIIITTILNIIGFLCILTSLIIIIKTVKKEENIYKEIVSKYKDIKYYYDSMDNIVNSISDIFHMGLNKVESYNALEIREHNGIDDFKVYKHPKNELQIEQHTDNHKEILKKIVELKKQGLSSKEIAKKLNKGIREVEIIIKMLENN